jgi:hypothetical protein
MVSYLGGQLQHQGDVWISSHMNAHQIKDRTQVPYSERSGTLISDMSLSAKQLQLVTVSCLKATIQYFFSLST